MQIYIEYVVLDNLIIDFLILYLVGMTTKSKFGKWNWVLALLQGISYAIITPFLTFNTYVVLLLKFLFSLLIVLSLKKYCNFKEFAVHYLLFITFTFVFGGLCYALLLALDIPYNANGLILNGYVLPISVLLLLAFIYVILLVKFIAYYHKQKHIRQYYYDVVLTIGGKDYFVRGFLDSGNMLYDETLASPVVVLALRSFCKIFKKFPFEKFVLDNVEACDLKNAHYIKVKSVDSMKNMLVFTADKITIRTMNTQIERQNVSLGISGKNFGGQFECLLHSDLMGEG